MMIDWTHIGPSVTAAFLGSLVEFIKALTIVLAVGTVRGWRSAMLGTSMGVLLLAALVAFLGPALGVIPIAVLQLVVGVLLLGLVLRRPLARVPENTLKFAVGILISAFGVFWVGEGLGFHWPGSDLSILGLTVGLLLISLVMVPLVRHRPTEESAE